MQSYALSLIVFFIVSKCFVRCWLFKPVHARPAWARHNETLRLFDLMANTALIAVFFMYLIARNKILFAVALTVGLVLYDVALKYWFMHVEIRKLRLAAPHRWSYRGARRHVTKRSKGAMFH